MLKRRRMIAVSPEAIQKLIQIQGKYQDKNKKRISMRDIADEIIKRTSIEEFEKKVMQNDVISGLKVKFD